MKDVLCCILGSHLPEGVEVDSQIAGCGSAGDLRAGASLGIGACSVGKGDGSAAAGADAHGSVIFTGAVLQGVMQAGLAEVAGFIIGEHVLPPYCSAKFL